MHFFFKGLLKVAITYIFYSVILPFLINWNIPMKRNISSTIWVSSVTACIGKARQILLSIYLRVFKT